ncbi:hypothetical protein CYMTET_15458 [Cymbomonas tetramitiformis]|uniref:Uncharacterized protein n=1 Tax=Cymbomonas tetramitiformis TaxID=36881 RepID=A0AAE0GE05_9CHLO|nr:hypothetical protein CYMTET_15458 [Cymbomonas tetramitiformis]
MTSEEASEDALVQQLDKHLQTRKKLQNGGDLAICPANFQYRKVTLNQILVYICKLVAILFRNNAAIVK